MACVIARDSGCVSEVEAILTELVLCMKRLYKVQSEDLDIALAMQRKGSPLTSRIIDISIDSSSHIIPPVVQAGLELMSGAVAKTRIGEIQERGVLLPGTAVDFGRHVSSGARLPVFELAATVSDVQKRSSTADEGAGRGQLRKFAGLLEDVPKSKTASCLLSKGRVGDGSPTRPNKQLLG